MTTIPPYDLEDAYDMDDFEAESEVLENAAIYALYSMLCWDYVAGDDD